MALNLTDPIEKIPFAGPKNIPKLKKLGIKTVKDLLWHFPFKYDDYSGAVPIIKLNPKTQASVQGYVASIKNIRSWKKRLHITTALIADNTETIRAVWFNRPYIAEQLKEGTLVSIAGKVSLDKEGLYFSAPVYEKVGQMENMGRELKLLHTAGLVAKYPETKGLTSKYIRFLIKNALAKISKIDDTLPETLIKKYEFPRISKALQNIHFPPSEKLAKISKERVAFEELLLFQLKALQARRKMAVLNAPRIKFEEKTVKQFVNSLPFRLTDDQKISAFEILKDMEKPYPMNRLLNGDVGSGKTVVALIAAHQAAIAGWQTAFMAPTEILARQHYQTMVKLMSDAQNYSGVKLKIGLLTGSEALQFPTDEITNEKISKKLMTEKIARGGMDIIAGTHALIQKGVEFKNLGLSVIDEQHRFGVGQRATLIKKQSDENNKFIPHLLSMTATPIPRTLALTVFGDLDISIIKEKPKGRKKIVTKVITTLEKENAYKFMDEEMEKGKQVFLVCPRIEASDPRKAINTTSRQKKINIAWQDVRAVKEEYEKISKKVFPHRRAAMLHGKLKPKEKEKIMEDFKNKEVDILVSTSVIEVGVDIPNATIMAIENSERFGLAQLHQFRGRVGRGKEQSYCLLICGVGEQSENRRLKVLVKSEDGFELAEKDLQIRGPGQFFGVQQTGAADLSMAALVNVDLIKKARNDARILLKNDPELKKYPILKYHLREFQKLRHFE